MDSTAVVTKANRPKSHGVGIVLLCSTLVVVALALWKFQDIQDYIHLYGYQPSTQISGIANQDTMTDYGRKLFYVNRPLVLGNGSFGKYCPSGAEKTVVLGCYKSNDAGIYLYNVQDPRLEGVVQVTAAHEMLHAAYARLSDVERKQVDTQLQDYFEHSLGDQRIKDTIEEYKISEPTELLNEMHSIFGTEVTNLPKALETYYSQYFTDRGAVVGLMTKYQTEFTGRQDRLNAYDAQLKNLKAEIDQNRVSIESLSSELDDKQARMDALRSDGSYSAYNALVGPYNSIVNRYNYLISYTRKKIEEYNFIVQERNGVVLEQQQLTQALSSTSLPTAK